MLQSKKLIAIVTLVLVVSFAAWAMAASSFVEQRSVLSGHVLSVVAPGTTVHEGSVLVVVGTITGPVPAVRATVDGTVKDVLVNPGDIIRQGDAAVRIEPVRK